AESEGRAYEHEDDELVAAGEFDEAVDHGRRPSRADCIWVSESRRKAAEVTMRSRGGRPLRISTRSLRRWPISTARRSKVPLPRSRKTVRLTPESSTASAGTVRRRAAPVW